MKTLPAKTWALSWLLVTVCWLPCAVAKSSSPWREPPPSEPPSAPVDPNRPISACPPEARPGQHPGRWPARRLPIYLGGALMAVAACTRYRDARRWRASKRELRRLQDRQTTAGRFMHDFNNLLTTIRGNADCADMELPRESPIRRYLEDIQLAVNAASRLCNEFLGGEDPEGKGSPSPMAIAPVLDELLRVLESTTLKHACIERDVAPELPRVSVAAGTFRQVLLNLLVNAAEALPETGGTIRVRAFVRICEPADLESPFLPPDYSPEAGNFVVVEVSDSGCGMAPETLKKIFEPYFTTKKNGKGLGLAALPEFIRNHGGSLQIDSRPDRGTSIRLYLPAA